MADQLFSPDYWIGFGRRAFELASSRGLLILALIFAYFIARIALFRILDAGVTRLAARQEAGVLTEERANRLRTLQNLTKNISSMVLLFILIVMILDAIGANISGIVATAGVGGLALGFGAQKLVKDVISGFFFIVEDQFVVGDYVSIGAATGTVEEVGMRITRIRDDQGKVWILANGDITAVVNHSRAPVESAIEVGVHPSADVSAAEELINEVGRKLFESETDRKLVAAPQTAGVSGWDAGKVTIRVTVTSDPRALACEQLKVRQAIHARLVQEGIQLA